MAEIHSASCITEIWLKKNEHVQSRKMNGAENGINTIGQTDRSQKNISLDDEEVFNLRHRGISISHSQGASKKTFV